MDLCNNRINLLLDIKIKIALLDIKVWMNLFAADEEFRKYVLNKNNFNFAMFQKEIRIDRIKRNNLLIINNKLCNLVDFSRSKSKNKNGTYGWVLIGTDIFINQKCEALLRLKSNDKIQIYS